MGTAIVLYILLLVIFLVISSLILRHAVKFNYLNPNFKYVVGIFGVVALVVITFSIYLLFQMDSSGGSTNYYEPTPYIPPATSTGNLNF
ncbi:hypothetical protein JXD20_01335 [Candidatus Peregrinibacteria bacterium]|nr:hypothetical protein [Candidatus Peregrinibacteria bacterium]